MKCTIDVAWPYEASFCNIASSKKKAAHDAALMCLDWLYMNRKVKNLKPVLYDYKSIDSLHKFQQFVNINLSPEFTSKIQSLIDTFNNVRFISNQNVCLILINIFIYYDYL